MKQTLSSLCAGEHTSPSPRVATTGRNYLMEKNLLSAAQQEQLEQLGYRVVFSDRGMVNPSENTYAVNYPNKRLEAVFNRYSHATFLTLALAWVEAWRDFEAGNHLVVHAFPLDEGFVLED